MNERPDFNEIKSYREFRQYYWYRQELQTVCKNLGAQANGTKAELNEIIRQYFESGTLPKPQRQPKRKALTDVLTDETTLLECGFCFNRKFRDFFSERTGIKNFKFNTDMVATAKKVRQNGDATFTLKDMLNVYYGKLHYAKHDNTSCEWNRFLKDFCADSRNAHFKNKLNAAATLWKIVKNSTLPKTYSYDLVEKHRDLLKSPTP